MASDKDFKVRIELEGRDEFAADARRAAQAANAAFRSSGSGLATGVPNLDVDPSGTPRRVKSLDRISAASARLARQERAEALSRLSLEEQLQRLLRRREAITGRLVDAQGNAYRTAVLNLGGRQLDAAIRGVRGRMGQTQGASGAIRDWLGGTGGYYTRRELFELAGFRGFAATAGARGLGSLLNLGGEGGDGAGSGVLGMSVGAVAAVGAGLVAAGLAAFGASKAISALVGSMRALSDTAVRSGLSTTEVQRINFAAGASGGSSNDLLAAVAKLRETNIAALSGDERAALLLSRAGLEAGGNPASQLFSLGAGLRGGSTSRGAVAGLVGEDVLPALMNGAAEAAKHFDELNIALDSADIQALSDAKDTLTHAFSTLGKQLLADVVPGLAGFARAINGVVGSAASAISNPPMVIRAGLLNSLLPGLGMLSTSRGNAGGGNAAADQAKAEAALEEESQIQRDREASSLDAKNNEHQLQSLLKAVTLRQRVNYLLGEQARLQRLTDGAKAGGDTLSYEIQRGRLLENTEALRGTVGQTELQRTNAGALASIGIFRGVNGEALANVPRQQLLTLRQIAALLRQLPKDQAQALVASL